MKTSEVERLIYEGRFDDALSSVKVFEKREDLTADDRLTCQLLKSRIQIKVGDYEDGLMLAEKALTESQGLRKPLQELDALIAMAEASWHLGKLDNSLETIEQGEKLLATLAGEPPAAIKQRKASLIYLRGRICWRKGELDQALEYYQQSLVLQEEIVNKQEIALSLNNIGIIFQQKGDFDQALDFYERGLALREEIGNKQDIAGSLNNLGVVLWQKGDLDQALIYYQRSLPLQEEIGNKQDIAGSLNNIGVVFWQKGDLDQALKYYQRSLPLQEEIGNKEKIAMSFNNIGLIYRDKGDLDRALEYYQNSLRLIKEIGNNQHIALSLSNVGEIYALKGALESALDYHQHSLALREKIGNKQDIANSLGDIGNIHYTKGELDQALDYYLKSLTFQEEIGKQQDIAMSLGNIGLIHHQKGNLDQALVWLDRSLTLCREIGNNLLTATTLFELVSVAVDKNSVEQAQLFLQHLQQINDEEDNKSINQRYRVAEALMLKTSTRIRDRGKAEELLDQVAKEEITHHQLTVMALLGLCDLLLAELRISSDPDVLAEVKAHVTRLFEIGKEQHSHWLLSETYMLKSKLALVELDVKSASQFLTKGQQIAEDWGLRRLAMKISSEHDALLNELNDWEDLIKSNASLQERLELVQLEKLVKRMIRKRAVEVPKLLPEQPVMLLILSEDGISLFSRNFLPESEVKDQLIGAFLTAITKFGTRIFESSETVDRIMYQEHTLAVKPFDSMVFCYVFKGQSYAALQKLDEFMKTVRTSAPAWNALKKSLHSLRTLASAEIIVIEELVDDIFFSSDGTG